MNAAPADTGRTHAAGAAEPADRASDASQADRASQAEPADPADADIETFYAATYARLVGALTVASGSRADAEELVQEAFARLLPRWAKVSGYEDPEAWVRTVAFRLSASRWRRAKVAARSLARLGAPPPAAPPDGDRLDTERLLAGLPRIYREVLVLHYAFGLPVEQIAHELGVPTGTVKSRLSRGRTVAAAAGGDRDE